MGRSDALEMYAAFALQGLMSRTTGPRQPHAVVAKEAFAVAAEMVKQRDAHLRRLDAQRDADEAAAERRVEAGK